MTQLDDEIRAAIGELVDAAPEPTPTSAWLDRAAGPVEPAPARRTNRVVLAAAAAVAIVLAGAALVWVSSTDESAPVTTEPAPVDTRPADTLPDDTVPGDTTAGVDGEEAEPVDPALPEVELDPDGITIAAGAIFGFEPGFGVSADDVLDTVTPILGEPDVDSGWLPAKRQVDENGNITVYTPCTELREYRELWWGDLSFGLWQAGSRTWLQYWTVGERRIGFNTPDVDPPTDGEPTGLTTEDGIGIGDPLDAIPLRPNVEVGADDRGWRTVIVSSANPDYRPLGVVPEARAGYYKLVLDVVTTIEGQSFNC